MELVWSAQTHMRPHRLSAKKREYWVSLADISRHLPVATHPLPVRLPPRQSDEASSRVACPMTTQV